MIYEIFVPGRLCILGEHSDWAAEYRNQCSGLSKGYAVVCTTNEGLYARCQGAPSRYMSFSSTDNSGDRNDLLVALDYDALRDVAAYDPYFGYAAGTAAVIMKKFSYRINNGIDIDNYCTTLPMGKGLSSSAAVCVMIAKAFDAVFKLHLKLDDIMEFAYSGEMLTPSRCGRMDQCVAMGANSIGLMEFDITGCSLKVIANKETLYFVVADLLSNKDTRKILKDLNACFPVPSNSTQALMHEYVNTNADISSSAVRAIQNGDTRALAGCINAAQELFDRCAQPNCPSELASPRLHSIMSDEVIKRMGLAAKGVGSQGDGSVQILCESFEAQQEILNEVERLGCIGFPLTIKPSSTAS